MIHVGKLHHQRHCGQRHLHGGGEKRGRPHHSEAAFITAREAELPERAEQQADQSAHRQPWG